MTETQLTRERMKGQFGKLLGDKEISSIRVSNAHRDLVKGIIEQGGVIIEELK